VTLQVKTLWFVSSVATLANVILVVVILILMRGSSGGVTGGSDAATSDVEESDPSSEFARPDGAPEEVPLARLLANPHDFDGRRVVVWDYVSYRPSAHGNSYLYGNPSDGRFEMTTNAIQLDYVGLEPAQFGSPRGLMEAQKREHGVALRKTQAIGSHAEGSTS
jgi:hypothetical protein